MSLVREMKKTAFGLVCDELYQVGSDFLDSKQKEKSQVSKCLTSDSEEEIIAKKLLHLIDKTREKDQLSFENENEFLVRINKIYKKLMDSVSGVLFQGDGLDSNLKKFTFNFSHKLKSMVVLFFKYNADMNLNYLEYYISCRETGMKLPSNYSILKMEAVGTLKNYLRKNPSYMYKGILTCVIESVENDRKHVNFAALNINQCYRNILDILNKFRLVLLDKRDQNLLPEITRVLDRSLKIVRTEFSRCATGQRFLLIKNYDPISKKIEEVKNDIVKNDLLYRNYKFGVFSGEKIVSNYLAKKIDGMLIRPRRI